MKATPGFEASRLTPVVTRLAGAHAVRADTGQGLGGAALVSPQAGGRPVEAVMALPRIDVPRPAALELSAFDHARDRRMKAYPAVESVGAKTHQPPAPVAVGLERLEHRQRAVFRVAAGDDRLVWFQEAVALGVEVLVGDDVTGDAARLEPVEDVQIDVEVPLTGHRSQVEDRAVARRMEHPAAVRMEVIDPAAELGMRVEMEIAALKLDERPTLHLLDRVPCRTGRNRWRDCWHRPGRWRSRPGRRPWRWRGRAAA